MCGENVLIYHGLFMCLGSPPRVRGKHEREGEVFFGQRITPACAGKTRTRVSVPPEKRDHPRVCGENLKKFCNAARTGGSPPRVRGKHVGLVKRATRSRITPACAGKTCILAHDNLVGEDHPRVCGENANRVGQHIYRGGSPPRVRGKLQRPPVLNLLHRITPACAGKTS